MALLDGKYGPYIKAGTKNVSLPEEYKDLEKAKTLTDEQIIQIVKDFKK